MNDLQGRFSKSGHGMYDVIRSDKFAMRWICNCPDWQFIARLSVTYLGGRVLLSLRNKVKQNVVIEAPSPSVCPYCAATKLVRHGVRHNRYGDLQRFSCRACGNRFTQNLGFEDMGANPQSITSAMQLYFTGESIGMFRSFYGSKVLKLTTRLFIVGLRNTSKSWDAI